jgi:hypothetical protein
VNADRPLRLVTINGFEEGLSDVEVGAFDEAIGTGIVSTNANMSNVVLLR